MSRFAPGIRRSALLLAGLSFPLGSVDAQIGISVKSGTTWTSRIELSTLQPLDFRWKWDGFETPTRVAWQLSTQTPTSTAATRSSDVIASETALRLPAKQGVYELFTVNPLADWPAKFYIRVRVDAGRKTAYSAWINVSVLQRTSFVANPTCAIVGEKTKPASGGTFGTTYYPAETKFFTSGETITSPWGNVWTYLMFKNTSRAEVSYRRHVVFWLNGENRTDKIEALLKKDSPSDTFNKELVRKLAAEKTDTVALKLGWPFGGKFEFYAYVMPVGAPSKECHFWANYMPG